MQRETGSATLEPFAEAYVRDPYPSYARLRAGTAAWHAEDLGVWVVSRYDDVHAVLSDAETFANQLTLAPVLPLCPHAAEIAVQLTLDPLLAAGDGPEHARTRRALMATFPSNPRKAAKYEPQIRARVDALIDELEPRREADLVRDFSFELSIRAILSLIGVPGEDFDRIKRWSDNEVALIWGAPSEAEQVQAAEGLVGFYRYCKRLVAARAAAPRDDIVSALLAYRDGDDAVVTEHEIASIAFNLLAAGHETTSNLLSNGALQLLSGDGWAELVADPGRIPNAVEEMLRHDAPLVGWLRNTTRDATVGGVTIPAGERVLLLIGAAHHDASRFERGERFDPTRPNAGDHLAFGAGRHFCPGAALARLEARVAFERLTRRLPRLALRPSFEPRYEPNFGFRMLHELPVVW